MSDPTPTPMTDARLEEIREAVGRFKSVQMPREMLNEIDYRRAEVDRLRAANADLVRPPMSDPTPEPKPMSLGRLAAIWDTVQRDPDWRASISPQTVADLVKEVHRLRNQPCPHVSTTDEGTSHCTLAESTIHPPGVERLERHGSETTIWPDDELKDRIEKLESWREDWQGLDGFRRVLELERRIEELEREVDHG